MPSLIMHSPCMDAASHQLEKWQGATSFGPCAGIIRPVNLGGANSRIFISLYIYIFMNLFIIYKIHLQNII